MRFRTPYLKRGGIYSFAAGVSISCGYLFFHGYRVYFFKYYFNDHCHQLVN